jgi:predicted dehydrogenase
MRVAVLGLGSIGARHARNLRALGHDVVAFDPRPADGAEDWPRADSVVGALSGSDAAVVATPTAMHAEHAIAALELDVPVLVEKPLAVDFPAAQRVAQAANERGVICAVAMNLRFHPAIQALRGLISDGSLGPIRYARASSGSDLRTWRPGTDYTTSYSAQSALGGGIVRDSIHELDYLTWLLGPATSVTAEVARVSDLEIDVEDVAVAVLRLSVGALASVDLTYVDPVYRRGCLLVGAEATARWDWTRGTVEVGRPRAAARVLDVAAGVSDTYIAEVKEFLGAITSGQSPCASAEEGAAVVRLADALLRSAATGQRITL